MCVIPSSSHLQGADKRSRVNFKCAICIWNVLLSTPLGKGDGNIGSADPSARCGDKGGLLGLRQYTRSNRQEVETRRSLNKVPKDAGRRGVGENIE